MFIPNLVHKITPSLKFKIKLNNMSKFVNVNDERSTPNANFNATFISTHIALPCIQSVFAPLVISNLNENMIEIMNSNLNEKHLYEIKMLKKFNEYNRDADVA